MNSHRLYFIRNEQQINRDVVGTVVFQKKGKKKRLYHACIPAQAVPDTLALQVLLEPQVPSEKCSYCAYTRSTAML
jgi:hypothetical protein